jgi:hypothetical protein
MATSTKVPLNSEYVLKGVSGASIVVVLDGTGSVGAAGDAPIAVGAGSIVVIRDGVDLTTRCASNSAAPLVFFRCSPNSLLAKSHL